jgi:hypothetical protein
VRGNAEIVEVDSDGNMIGVKEAEETENGGEEGDLSYTLFLDILFLIIIIPLVYLPPPLLSAPSCLLFSPTYILNFF